MGKARKYNMFTSSNANPIGLPRKCELSDLLEDNAYDTSDSGPLESISGQLQSSNNEEKLIGLQAFAVLLDNREKAHEICNTDLVRIAAPFLCESDVAVRDATAGALRNLSVHGLEVCEKLVDSDVMTPLLTLLNEYACDHSWLPTFDAAAKNQIDLKSDIFLQAINLLWNLCESSTEALQMLNDSKLLERFLRCLDYKAFGLEVAISLSQCLLVASENNPDCWSLLNNHVTNLLSILNGDCDDHEGLYLRTLIAGILSNIPDILNQYSSVILKVLSEALAINHVRAVKDVTTPQPSEEKHNNAPEVEIHMEDAENEEETEEAASLRRRREELPTDEEIGIMKVGRLLDAQRLAAEIITNLCSTDEEDDDNDLCDDDDDNECFPLYGSNEESLTTAEKLPVEFLESLKFLNIIEKLWKRAQPFDEDFSHLERDFQVKLLTKIRNLRIACLLCLQNICNAVTLEDFGGAKCTYDMWVELGKQVFQGSEDSALLEPLTSLMRSALEHLKDSKDLFNQMTKDDLNLMLGGVNNCSMAEIRANWLRMLGTLGCLLPEALVKIIITFILNRCTIELDAWTMSEGLDALMDIFHDNDWTQLVLELRLYDRVRSLAKIFKEKVRQQKRSLSERYPAVRTVQMNFARFVVHIKNESSKCA